VRGEADWGAEAVSAREKRSTVLYGHEQGGREQRNVKGKKIKGWTEHKLSICRDDGWRR